MKIINLHFISIFFFFLEYWDFINQIRVNFTLHSFQFIYNMYYSKQKIIIYYLSNEMRNNFLLKDF